MEKLQVFALCCKHQLAVFHSPQAQNPVGQMAYLGAPPPHDDHFQAIVVVQVDVRGGQHFVFGVVLRIEQRNEKRPAHRVWVTASEMGIAFD